MNEIATESKRNGASRHSFTRLVSRTDLNRMGYRKTAANTYTKKRKNKVRDSLVKIWLIVDRGHMELHCMENENTSTWHSTDGGFGTTLNDIKEWECYALCG